MYAHSLSFFDVILMVYMDTSILNYYTFELILHPNKLTFLIKIAYVDGLFCSS